MSGPATISDVLNAARRIATHLAAWDGAKSERSLLRCARLELEMRGVSEGYLNEGARAAMAYAYLAEWVIPWVPTGGSSDPQKASALLARTRPLSLYICGSKHP